MPVHPVGKLLVTENQLVPSRGKAQPNQQNNSQK